MAEQNNIDIADRIIARIRKAQRQLFERKVKLGEIVVSVDNDGTALS